MKNDAFSWDDLRVLLEVDRRRSFLGAGKALGLSTSTVGRRIDALELALGRKLVHRTTAGTSIDPAARALVALAEGMERELRVEGRDARGVESLEGVVRVSVKESFARPMAKVLSEWRRIHPETLIELASEARLADVAKREADLGVRTVRSSSKALVEKRLGTFSYGLWASNEYVERHLRDGHLRDADFPRHDFVGYDGPGRESEQERWLVARGARRFPFRSSSDDALLTAASESQGIFIFADALARDVPGLRRLVCPTPLPTVSVYLVVHRDLRRVPRIRGVAGAIEEAIRQIAVREKARG
ncbi:LysR family transcriptional regulator [Sorangium atrum]|uniref:LysR family transcriptional regulator n=1 Tax=Sorangium atrum TaxID=2995308 RepID=A0ABT5C8C6_9BACT|nr:LysR family transcriptional regulator [Sorangium aterium]MDC0682680.1 LysR family transcriptional regulator [Sorangium aterium]